MIPARKPGQARPGKARSSNRALQAGLGDPSGIRTKVEVPSVRNYVPKDDGLEPTDFDEYYDYPAQTAKDLAARVYVTIERDPGRG